ncbi:MAG: class II aldolase/adducin family protein [Bacteroidetes bacterium]|nr:class II aldolase/adducin family protein [Bacteroidota bacterium]MBU1721058.1 class II aldolase/adducin family protein [Bacteroidota bacterium]
MSKSDEIIHLSAKLLKHGVTDSKQTFFILSGDTIPVGLPERFVGLKELLPSASLIISAPHEPFQNILKAMTEGQSDDFIITPTDSESLLFLPAVHFIENADSQRIAELLSAKNAMIADRKWIIAKGNLRPGEAYIHYSVAYFSLFVNFFVDLLEDLKQGKQISHLRQNAAIEALSHYFNHVIGPLKEERKIVLPEGNDSSAKTLEFFGKLLVENQLVDSCFGNISCKRENTLLISQTQSSLDELAGSLVEVPISGQSASDKAASSELPAHRAIYQNHAFSNILHGHPRFAVILSLLCEKDNCEQRRHCHTHCAESRTIADIPVVSGEAGSGPFSLSKTVPPAIASGATIVLGHGVFAAANSMRTCYETIRETEIRCFEEVKQLLHKQLNSAYRP